MAEDIERLRQAALRDPAQLVRLADALVAQDRADEAVQACRRGLMSRPDDVALRLALGRALSAAGQLEEAQQVLLDAVARQQRARSSTAPARPAPAPAPPATTPRGPAFSPPPPPRPAPRGDATEVSTAPQFVIREEPTARAAYASPPASIPWSETPSRGQPRPEPAAATPRASSSPMAGYPSPSPMAGYPSAMAGHSALDDYASPPSAYAPLADDDYARPDPYRSPAGPIDLETVAAALLGGGGSSDEPGHGEPADWEAAPPPPPVDEMERAWDARRARTFTVLWVLLVLGAGGGIGGWIWHLREQERELNALVARADVRMLEATDEGDRAGRDAYAEALRTQPHERRYFAMVAYADARLAADQGEDSDAAAWAMMKRAEKEAKRHPPAPDARTDRDLRQARALLALARGEACPALNEAEDGDVAARCAAQKGDIAGGRRVLAQTLTRDGEGRSIRALLALGSLELGAGDLDAADAAYGKVLAVYPHHPRALVGRTLVALERNEAPAVTPPPGRIGPTSEAWFHLAAGLAALGRAGAAAQASYELGEARKGIVHDGRLALLYGRACLMQGKIAEAEQAMRVAERLEPNDADVAVLDAEVALAKGFEDKVVTALAVGPSTPRKLAVLGRAQALTGRYREAVATLDAALARRPGDAVAITYRAISRAHLGEQAAALRELEKAATTLSSTTPRYGLGLIAFERHDYARARGELSKALERNSESFRARVLLGRVWRELGKPKEALAELEQVAREAPALTATHAALARLYLDLGRDREARNAARKVLDGGRATADDKLAYAEATIRLGRVDDGDRALKDAVAAGVPESRLGLLRLVLQSWRGPKEAVLAAKALEKERRGPAARDPRLTIEAADAWRRAGDLRKATDDLREALAADPLHANLGLGRLALAQAQLPDAELAYRAALSAWGRGAFGVDDETEGRVGLGRTLLARDPRSKEGTETLEAAIKDDATAAEPRYWLARAYADQGDAAHARTQAERATELDDGYADAFLLLGDLTRGSDRERARKAYKRYLELAPDGAQVKIVKRWLGVK